MRLEIAEALVDASEGRLDLYEDYSGRGMYGRTTAGVTGDSYDLFPALVELGIRIGEGELEDMDIEEFHFSQDSMGLDTIWY
jgi:hypothetical protein